MIGTRPGRLRALHPGDAATAIVLSVAVLRTP